MLDNDTVEARLDILNDSDAVCEGCGADPRDAPDVARDERWLMETVQTRDERAPAERSPVYAVARVCCPACW